MDLLTNRFKGHLACSDKKFVEHIEKLKDDCKEGANIEHKLLMTKAQQKHKTRVLANAWNAPTEEQEEIIALQAEVKEMKARERQTGAAEVESMNIHLRCMENRATSEEEARERKASKIAAYLVDAGIASANAAGMSQAERDAIARQTGQRSPSEKTWDVVLSKLAA